jgi:thiamine-phosphate pyrophosphorylase
MANKPAVPGLCLLAEIRQGADWLSLVGEALDATGAVTLVLGAPRDANLDQTAARALVDLAQKKNVAALLVDDLAAARAVGADGVHLNWRPEIDEAYAAARATLGAGSIIGADAGFSRHDAMSLGEAGADYVAFGQPPEDMPPEEAASAETADERLGFITWWAEIFVVPAVAFDVPTNDEVASLARAGADFIAVRLPENLSGQAAVREWAAGLAAALRAPAGAA